MIIHNKIIKYRYLLLTGAILIAGFGVLSSCAKTLPNKSLLKGYVYNIKDFGSVSGKEVLNTAAIQKTIDACAETGGTVYIPPGQYLSGSLNMKSNVVLHIASGATLLGSTDIEDYEEHIPNIRSYNDIFLKHSLIYGEDLENITITGQGIIDGQGGAFKITTNKKPDRYKNRPYIIRFVDCKNVLVENITLRNSAMWMQHYFVCEDLVVRGIRVYNHCNKNNDMIDIDGCKNVIVSDCIGDTDDDALCIKSTGGHASENITVTNCVLSSHCNAIKMGTESHSGFKNITISNIVIKPSSDRDIIYGRENGISGITLGCVDGGELEGVIISNIRMHGPETPICLRLGNRGRIYQKGMEKPEIGSFRDVIISNVIATGAGQIGCSLTGLPDHPIKNVRLHNINIQYKGGGILADAHKAVPENEDHYPESDMFGILPAYGFFIRHAENIELKDINISFQKEEQRYALIADDVTNFDLVNFQAQGSISASGLIKLVNSKDVFITQSRVISHINTFLMLSGSKTERISVLGNVLSGADRSIHFDQGVPISVLEKGSNIGCPD